MKGILTVVFLVLCNIYVSAQKHTEFQILLLDKKKEKPISGAHISNGKTVVTTDENGKLKILLKAPYRLEVSHIAYRDTSIKLDPSKPRLALFLEQDIQTLGPVAISGKPYEIFTPEETHVFDYDFLGDTLLALTYEKQKMVRRHEDQGREMYLGCKLIVVSPSGNILFTRRLNHLISGFYRDGLGQLFILGDEQVSLVTINSIYGPMFAEVDVALFEEQIKPLKVSNDSSYFFDDQTWDYPEFTHYRQDKKTGEAIAVRTIRDDFTMELFRAAYKYMGNREKLNAIRLETQTGIDKEIYGAYMSGFQHSPYYESIYAPIFQLGDTTAIFDHHNHYIFFHDVNGVPIDSIPLQYCEKSVGKFARQLVKARDGNDMYAMYKKSGRKYLRSIDVSSGRAGEKIELYYPYPEQIKVCNNRVYYIYRKPNGESTKHLFAEDLR